MSRLGHFSHLTEKIFRGPRPGLGHQSGALDRSSVWGESLLSDTFSTPALQKCIFSKFTTPIYRIEIWDFMFYTGIREAVEFRLITRAHVIAYRDELARRGLQGATIRRKLAAVSSLYEYLCDRNAVPMNPVKGVTRPKVDTYEGKTPALSDSQVRHLLEAPKGQTLKAKRDRAPAGSQLSPPLATSTSPTRRV